VRAVVGVDAGVWKAEALDGTAMEEVFLNDLFRVVGVDETVPDGFGIDDEYGAVLALIEAAGLVYADAVLEAGGLDGILERAAKFLAVFEGAAGARGFVSLVETDKEVMFEDWHRRLDAGCKAEMRGRSEAAGGVACENKGYGI
jgi:hypothetical protein